ncbi:hypothetical protein BASA81_005410 [Batrachochytrium salamandrivorans]|nr:hypothetical protein BASA81_005410 [Batrachochytrium salamandrivorans]
MDQLVAELKSWERDFKAVHGRKPELKDTPKPVLAKYRAVLELKSKRAKLDQEPIVLPNLPSSSKPVTLANRPALIDAEEVFPIAKPATSVVKSTRPNFEQLKRIKTMPAAVVSGEEDKPMDIAEFTARRKQAAVPVSATATVATATISTNFLASCKPTSEPNYVRINLKHDWKAARKKPAKTAKPKREPKERDAAAAAAAPDVISTILDLIDAPPQEQVQQEQPGEVRCGHHLPCQEFTVKKLSNRGRKFYGCSLGWQGSCGFFQWKDDTVQAAKQAFRGDADVVTFDAFSLLSVAELKLALARLCLPLPKPTNRSSLREALAAGWALRQQEALALPVATCTPQQVLRTVFFHEEFHTSQRVAIDRLLVDRKNTLLVSSTGSGKSLVYQLPCFVLPHLTIVISPLVSLMLDQVGQLPPGIKGSVLMGTQAQQATVLADVLAGRCKLLYLSPERLFTQSFQTLARKLECSLVCVDEAHCMTSWSHNFRPCYLRLGEVIPKLFPNALVLALTATATVAVCREICQSLGIDFVEHQAASQSSSWQRDNLHLSVEQVDNVGKRFARLAEMLQQDDNAKQQGTIVYSSTKHETTMLAERLATQHGLTSVAPYHAGLEHKQRKQTQERFLGNKLQVVVATVAFGMGLNKPNVRRVVHYGMPRSIEEYAQEIGRAGRDGNDSTCKLFYDVEEAQRLLALSKSDGMEPSQLQLLLDLLRFGGGGMQAVFCKQTSLLMDCKEGAVETLLVFLSQQRHEWGTVEMLANGYGRAQVALSGKTANCPALVHALKYLGGDLVDLLDLMREIKRMDGPGNSDKLTLANLIRQLSVAKEDGFLTSFSLLDPCWFVQVQATTNHDDRGGEKKLLARMFEYCSGLERKASESVQLMYSMCEIGREDAGRMKQAISNYLELEQTLDEAAAAGATRIPTRVLDDIAKRAIAGDCKSLLLDAHFSSHTSALKTSRAVARIFHGITSVVFTFEAWSKHRLWGRYREYDFGELKDFLSSLVVHNNC